MKAYLRDHVIATWARYGDCKPLSDELIAFIVRMMNEPITLPMIGPIVIDAPPSRFPFGTAPLTFGPLP